MDITRDLTALIKQLNGRLYPVEMKQFDLLNAIIQIYAALLKIERDRNTGKMDSINAELEGIKTAIESFMKRSKEAADEQ